MHTFYWSDLTSWRRRLISIYDCRVVLHWKGTAADGTVATGKLVVPEVSHEITLDGLSDYSVRFSTPKSCSILTPTYFPDK